MRDPTMSLQCRRKKSHWVKTPLAFANHSHYYPLHRECVAELLVWATRSGAMSWGGIAPVFLCLVL